MIYCVNCPCDIKFQVIHFKQFRRLITLDENFYKKPFKHLYDHFDLRVLICFIITEFFIKSVRYFFLFVGLRMAVIIFSF
jgi:hypothetical protein